MNLLFLSAKYPPHSTGGGEISTHLIARGLADRRHNVSVVCEGSPAIDHLDGVTVYRRSFGLAKKPLYEKRAAQKAAKRFVQESHTFLDRSTIVHAHDFRSGLMLAVLLDMGVIIPKQAYITFRDYAAISGDTNNLMRDGSIPEHPLGMMAAFRSRRVEEASFGRSIARFLQYYVNIRYRNTMLASIPHHFFISDAQRQQLTPFLHSQGLRAGDLDGVLYNPVGSEYLADCVPSDELSVLYAGRLEHYKGVGILLKAWQEIHRQFPSARLRLLGRGAQQEDYRQFVSKAGLSNSVQIVSHVPYDQMIAEFDRAGVVVSPHVWQEPFGRTVAEGMARGKVVVASDFGGPGELIQDGKTGFLCTRNSVRDLARCLQNVFELGSQERYRIGQAAHVWASQNLSMKKIAAQHEQLYLQTRF